MNPFDMVRASAGDSMMPMVIFIIWVVISMVSASNKKKRRLRKMEEQERVPQAEPAAGDEPGWRRVESREPDDDILRQLEVVLDDRQGSAEQSQADDAADDAAGIEARVPERAPVYEALAQHLPSVAPVIAEVIIAEESSGVFEIDSVDEVRRGIIWSEILAQPKALREQEQDR